MKFMKITQTVTFEMAVPVGDEFLVGPIVGDDAEDLQTGSKQTMVDQAKAMGAKLIDCSTTGEIVEV